MGKVINTGIDAQKSGQFLKRHEGNPLVMICGYGDPLVSTPEGLKPQFEHAELMGFVCEVFDKKVSLVVSCSNGFTTLENYFFTCVVTENPDPTGLEIVGKLCDTKPGTNIGFMVVRDVTEDAPPTQPLVLEQHDPPPLKAGRILYVASSELANPFDLNFEVSVYQQIAKEETAMIFRDTAVYRHVPISSFRGCLGSPVWDNDRRLYGLNLGWANPPDSGFSKVGGELICIPTSKLYEARQRIQPQLEELLAKTQNA